MKKAKVLKTLAVCTIFASCAITVSCGGGSASSSSNSTTSSSATSSSTETSNSIVTVNKLALERKVDYVKRNYVDKEGAGYTEASYTALKNAYDQAVLVLAKADATQSEVDAALTELSAKETALVADVKPSKKLSEIENYLISLEGNYTLKVKDHFSKPEYQTTPLEYKILADGQSVFDDKLNQGITCYDGKIHEFSLNESQEVVMGRPYLADGMSAPKHVSSNRFGINGAYVLGVSEPWAEGLTTYGGFVSKVNSTEYVTDNVRFFDNYLNLTFGRYDYGADIETMMSAGTLSFENNTLIGKLIGSDDKVAFEFELTGAKTTEIGNMEAYKKANPTYQANAKYKPEVSAQKVVSDLATNTSGLEIDVYSNRRGLSSQEPNFTLTSRRNDEGTSYWVSSRGYGFIEDNGVTSRVSVNAGKYQIGESIAGSLKFQNTFSTVIRDFNEARNLLGYDEYFLNVDPLFGNDLYAFFDLGNYQDWATKNYFGDPIDPIELEATRLVSLSTNEEGFLTMSLWNKLGDDANPDVSLIARAVIRKSTGVTINELDDIKNVYIEKLKSTITTYKDVNNDSGAYEEKSYKIFDETRKYANTLVSSTSVDTNELKNVRAMLIRSHNELEKKDFVPVVDGGKKIVNFIDDTLNAEYSIQSHKVDYVVDGKEGSYVFTSNYYYDITNQKGYIRLEGNVFDFTVDTETNEVVIGSPVLAMGGFSKTSIGGVVDYPQTSGMLINDEYGTVNPTEHMARIGGTNEYFMKDNVYASFIPGLDSTTLEGLGGIGLELNGDTLDINVYEKASSKLNIEGLTPVEAASSLRSGFYASATISEVGTAKIEELEAFLKNPTLPDNRQMIEIIAGMPVDTMRVTMGGSNEEFLLGPNYFYDAQLDTAFFVSYDGSIKTIEFVPDEQTGTPFTIGSIVDSQNQPVTDPTEWIPSLDAFKGLKADELGDFALPTGTPSKLLYSLPTERATKLKVLFGHTTTEDLDPTALGITFDGNRNFVVAERASTGYPNRYEAYAIFSGDLSTLEGKAQMIKNIMMAF